VLLRILLMHRPAGNARAALLVLVEDAGSVDDIDELASDIRIDR
jgi:hypothetical protein